MSSDEHSKNRSPSDKPKPETAPRTPTPAFPSTFGSQQSPTPHEGSSQAPHPANAPPPPAQAETMVGLPAIGRLVNPPPPSPTPSPSDSTTLPSKGGVTASRVEAEPALGQSSSGVGDAIHHPSPAETMVGVPAIGRPISPPPTQNTGAASTLLGVPAIGKAVGSQNLQNMGADSTLLGVPAIGKAVGSQNLQNMGADSTLLGVPAIGKAVVSQNLQSPGAASTLLGVPAIGKPVTSQNPQSAGTASTQLGVPAIGKSVAPQNPPIAGADSTLLGVPAIGKPVAPQSPPSPGAASTLLGVPAIGKPVAPQNPPSTGADSTLLGVPAIEKPVAPQNLQSPGAASTLLGVPAIGKPLTPQPPSDAGVAATLLGMAAVGKPEAEPHSTPSAVPASADGTLIGVPAISTGTSPLESEDSSLPPEASSSPAATLLGVAALGTQAPVSHRSSPDPLPDVSSGSAASASEGATLVGMPALGSATQLPPEVQASSQGPFPLGYADVEEVAGSGNGIGQVFRARWEESGALLALRVLPQEVAADSTALERLRLLGELSSEANHPHLGAQYGLDERGAPLLVSEYVTGMRLDQLMGSRGAAPPAAVIDLGLRLASAVAVAHSAGLAHGDLRAANIILEAKTSRWVLLDLGHLYSVEEYLEPLHDLYALAALLYELGTAHSPFVEGADETLDPRHYNPQIPEALANLLLRSLSPRPENWCESALEFAKHLAACR